MLSSSQFICNISSHGILHHGQSLGLSESLVDEREALATHRRLAEEAGLSEKIATLLVDNMGYRTLEDLEDLSEAQVEDKIIPAITDLDTPLVMGSRLKKLIKAIRKAAEVSWERKRKITAEDEDVSPTIRGDETRGVSPFQQVQA